MDLKQIVDKVGEEVDALLGHQTKDTTFRSEHAYPDEPTATEAFARSVTKLFAVNGWSNLPGLTSTFTLHAPTGQLKPDQPVQVGDFVRIELPVPGPFPDNWVTVTAKRQTDTVAEFTVVPSPNPQQTGETAPVEHFFGPEASSTFRVERQGTWLIGSELGRNERVNNEETTAGDRGVVNTLIAAGGWAYFQRMQWKKLTDYLVHL